MRAALVVCLLAGSAAAAPTRTVAGQKLAVLDAEPAFDEGAFIAGPKLAKTYRDKLATTALDDDEKQALKLDALPNGLFLVRVHEDGGKRYLYKPCDGMYHGRTLITDTHVFMLGIEPLAVPIAKTQKKGKLTTIELDTKGLPPMIASKLRVRTTRTAGIYELAANDDDDFSELLATPAAAAKLDVIVRVCKKAKASELSFSR